ncbi:type II toxin-antitoxin system PemK/MazF family toxin [Ampullimonas aquatilis]|uniref:type II toxin-antitoxin system PemK/MazF family toxin n=1 Tax=Ampullimonas aquatilis TaxID=1341549 RepID=UPI003C77F54A
MAPRKLWVPERRDVIWIDCNPQVGREMKDLHPLLVLSPKAFNERTGIVIGLPMTTATYNETNPFAIKHIGSKKVVSYILTHQPKSFDWKMRHAKAHPMKQLPEEVFALACESLNQIIAIAG